MCGFIVQLVEHPIGVAEVTGLNTVEALIFLFRILSNRLNWKIYCHDHSSLSQTRYVPNPYYTIYYNLVFNSTLKKYVLLN